MRCGGSGCGDQGAAASAARFGESGKFLENGTDAFAVPLVKTADHARELSAGFDTDAVPEDPGAVIEAGDFSPGNFLVAVRKAEESRRHDQDAVAIDVDFLAKEPVADEEGGDKTGSQRERLDVEGGGFGLKPVAAPAALRGFLRAARKAVGAGLSFDEDAAETARRSVLGNLGTAIRTGFHRLSGVEGHSFSGLFYSGFLRVT